MGVGLGIAVKRVGLGLGIAVKRVELGLGIAAKGWAGDSSKGVGLGLGSAGDSSKGVGLGLGGCSATTVDLIPVHGHLLSNGRTRAYATRRGPSMKWL